MIQMKTCTRCREAKPLDQFHKQKTGKYGVNSECKPCNYLRTQAWSAANPEKARSARSLAQRNYKRRMREKAVQALGGECAHCGLVDPRVMHIDHVDGGGLAHRETTSAATFYLSIVRGTCTHEVQLLCANCHMIKTYGSTLER